MQQTLYSRAPMTANLASTDSVQPSGRPRPIYVARRLDRDARRRSSSSRPGSRTGAFARPTTQASRRARARDRGCGRRRGAAGGAAPRTSAATRCARSATASWAARRARAASSRPSPASRSATREVEIERGALTFRLAAEEAERGRRGDPARPQRGIARAGRHHQAVPDRSRSPASARSTFRWTWLRTRSRRRSPQAARSC